MKLRKVKVDLLIKKAIAYRVLVLFTQFGFMWLITKNVPFSIGISIAWNIINTVEYFGFDYIFSRIFTIGRDDEFKK